MKVKASELWLLSLVTENGYFSLWLNVYDINYGPNFNQMYLIFVELSKPLRLC